MAAKEPVSIEDITEEYLSQVAGKMLGDPSVEVTSFGVIHDPFEFPRFGQKEFYEIPFRYHSKACDGESSIILRVMPEMDAVMMLTGDTEHRELKAFQCGLLSEIATTFDIPYVEVIAAGARPVLGLAARRAAANGSARHAHKGPGRSRAHDSLASRRFPREVLGAP